MVGQKHLLHTLDTYIENNDLPSFIIFYGPSGSGKKTIARYLANKIGNVIETGVSVGDVRTVIDSCYNVHSATAYIIPDADNMSANAKNALLKVTEEPPNKSHIIMTLEDMNNTLATIKSRACAFPMECYTVEDMSEYIGDDENSDMLSMVCSTPGDVNVLNDSSAVDFYNYVEKVVDNISEVTDANAFKIGSKVAIKEEGYDLKLFWKIFITICMNRYSEDIDRYAKGVKITSKYLAELRNKSINRQMAFDNWILEVRKAWM